MEKKKKRAKIFETKNFGFLIGAVIILIFLAASQWTTILDNLETRMLDVHFNYKNVFLKESIQEGVSYEQQNPNISPDILIVGIDFKTLDRFGKWPFPRWRHADLLKSFSRIQNQNERERAVFLDIFFIEPDKEATHDTILIDAIEENGRVFLETVLDEVPPPSANADEYFARQQRLYESYGELVNIVGDWEKVPAYYGLQPPLQPYGRATYGYGHANFAKDVDGTFRRQALVAKSAVLVETLRLDDLTPDTPLDREKFQRFEWIDIDGLHHTIDYPLTEEVLSRLKTQMETKAPLKAVDNDGDGTPDEEFYVVRKYQDHFVPSITLSLALEYFNKSLDDIEVVLGDYIFIPHPEYFDVETQTWVPYELVKKPAVYAGEEDAAEDESIQPGDLLEEAETELITEIKIPIDEHGNMLINFMGPPSFADPGARQTFPIRSYSGYAANPPGIDPSGWGRTKAVGNKLLMVGPFARGMAADQKTTPYGLMYGVEIHANALNTIIMNKFLVNVPYWVDLLILIGVVMLIAFLASRLSTVWAFIVSLVFIFILFLAITIIFEQHAVIINFTTPAISILFTFLSIVVYRAMTEEKDKRRIKNMFGTYVSPRVVDQILDTPPELGGVDKNLTVFFSDIRGFTTLSETMTPQELVLLLNRYLTAMTDIILETEGTLDKYEGDAIMAFWGAPLPQEDHAYRACKASLKQIEALQALNEELAEEKRINIGIGLNSGIMTVGNMGSLQRMDYTLIGDNVNLGARLEGTNKQYGTNIILSEYTYGLVKDLVVVRELDNIRVKGKNKPVLIYELIDVLDEKDRPKAETN